jgi:hypothetical protein
VADAVEAALVCAEHGDGDDAEEEALQGASEAQG